MLDLLTFRIIAGFLLASSFGVIYLSRRRDDRVRPRPYTPVTVRHVPRFLHVLWVVVAILVPLAAIILAISIPGVVYGTPLNISFPGDTVVQYGAIGLFSIGGMLLVSSGRSLGRFMVIDIAVAEDHQLITSGPYARIRHPAYAGVLLLGVAASLYMLNLLLAVNFLVALAVATYRARLEEELLASSAGFGARYREYMARTGRFLPKLTRSQGSRPRPPRGGR